MQYIPVIRPATPRSPGTRQIESDSSGAVTPIGGEHASVARQAVPGKAAAVAAHQPVLQTAHEPEHELRERQKTDRRAYCRRIVDHPVLIDLRSKIDRRHRNQRSQDLTTAIDEEA